MADVALTYALHRVRPTSRCRDPVAVALNAVRAPLLRAHCSRSATSGRAFYRRVAEMAELKCFDDEHGARRDPRAAQRWPRSERSQGSGMTVPPGPVIPVPLLPSRRTDADIRRRPARCFPFRSVNGRWRRRERSTGRFVQFGRCTFGRVDRTDLARRIYDAAHLTGTFTLRSGVVSNEYFDKYRFESDPQLLADIADGLRAARARPASTRWPASSWAASRSPR